MPIINFLSIVALIGSVAWMAAVPDYEPALAIIASLSTLIANLVVKKRNRADPSQQQTISGNGIGIQAGGDAKVGDVGNKR